MHECDHVYIFCTKGTGKEWTVLELNVTNQDGILKSETVISIPSYKMSKDYMYDVFVCV